MSRYVYYQPNDMDLKDERYDDPIRALTLIFGTIWEEVFEDLTPIARKFKCSHNDKICYEYYLASKGYVYYGVSNKRGSRRPTVESFVNDNPKGKYFLNIANHCVGVMDGKYYNTWDCGYKSLYGVWALPGTLMEGKTYVRK